MLRIVGMHLLSVKHMESRMFRFTIRELLLLTVIAAVGVAWWIDRSRLAAELKELRDWWPRYGEIREGFMPDVF